MGGLVIEFLGADLHQLLAGEGQADVGGRSQEQSHPFLLLGFLQFTDICDPSSLRPPTEGTLFMTPCPTLRDLDSLTQAAVILSRSHTTPD